MFLHSGASLHGHEYSTKPAPAAQQHTQNRSPLLRSAFAHSRSRPVSLDGGARPPPPSALEFYRRPLSECIPRIVEPVVRFAEPLDPLDSDEDLPTPMSEDVVSVSGSEFSDSSHPSEATAVETPRRRRRSKAVRSTTTYALAYPAPRFAAKSRVVKKVAPKLYLQLQEVTADRRPRPIIDVFPSSRIAGPVIAPRLAKRFPRLFGPRGELGSDDVVLMRSEDYDTTSEDSHSDEEECHLERRQPVAVLSPRRKSEHTEVVLDDGSVWVAKPLPTGSFDFVHVNAHGVTTTARWVRRAGPKPASQQASESSVSKSGQPTVDSPEAKYTFSIINPLSRRHPIMATLTPALLNIQDTYTTVSASSGLYPPSSKPLARANTLATPRRSSPLRPSSARSLSMNAVDDDSDDAVQLSSPAQERTTHPVDDATKLLISVTAVWVALQSGWSPFYTPAVHHPTDSTADSVASGSATTSPPTVRAGCRGARSRGNSLEITNLPPLSLHSGPSNSTSLASVGLRSRDQSPARSFCSVTTYLPPWWETRTMPTSPAGPIASPPPPPAPAIRCPTPDTRPPMGPRRATSTGAAFMQRSRIASINRVEEEESSDDANQQRRRPRILSGNGQRAMVRHTISAPPTPTTRALEAVVVSIPEIPGSTTPSKSDCSRVQVPSTAPTTPAAAATAAVPRPERGGERRTQSAYFAPRSVVHFDVAQQQQQHQQQHPHRSSSRAAKHASVHIMPVHNQPPMAIPESGGGRRTQANDHHQPQRPPRGARGLSSKFKNIGHWFRRLGGTAQASAS